MNKDLENMLSEVAKHGSDQIKKAEAQLAVWKLEPDKYATQIKFQELALKN